MTIKERIQRGDFLPELRFETARSGGPGGQHVNKVETKVYLKFEVMTSVVLGEEEKLTLIQKNRTKVDQLGMFQLYCQETRSQLQNKDLVIRKFYELLLHTFQKKKIRKASRPSKSAIEKRLKDKKDHSVKKASRRGEE